MDAIEIFHYELHSLLDSKPPVSKAKMGLITKAAMKGVKFYKHIVPIVEKFIAKCSPEYKVPGLYVIDSIVRQSRHQFGPDRDVYAARFSRNLQSTFNNLFARCSADDRPKIVRVLNLWQKNGVFNSMVIQPLLDMANPNSSFALPSESTQSAESPGIIEAGKQGHTSKYHQHHFSESSSNSQYNKNSSTSIKNNSRSSDSAGGGLRFSKNMLDFDYDEEDDDDGDETPTEAELPLSSFLSKIEMEERSRSERITSNNIPSQMQQQSQTISLQTPSTQAQQQNMIKNDQDPVLERWNRLFKQQIDPNDTRQAVQPTELKLQRSRSRSRSPAAREKVVEQSERTPPRQKSPPIRSAERELEKKAERERKCLPKIRDKHLTVCSSTLWLGHVPKTVSEADISDAFGEFGTINSIDLIPPRGCAYVCMDRRQDAKRALSESKDLRLNGSQIKMAWAPGKGFKEYKKLKEFWEVDIGSSYIPFNKIDETIDFDILEEGGVIDEDSMSMEMREMRERGAREKESNKNKDGQPNISLPLPTLPILSQPPPFPMSAPNLSIPPPTALGQNAGLRGIPFPPPGIVASSSTGGGPISINMPSQDSSKESHELLQSPASLDHQLSMTERQINMVEQQLSMIQQAQSMGHTQQSPMIPQNIFHQSQANHMMFDLAPAQVIHNAGSMMMDPQQLSVFTNPSLLSQPAPMIPISQTGSMLNPNIHGNPMPPYNGNRY